MRYTSYADRQEIVTLHQQGYSYRQIAAQTKWSFETVRKICRNYNREGAKALEPGSGGRPAKGPLSTFDPLVRFACLRIKRQHRGWGPDVVLAELANCSWSGRVTLPGPSQIGAYFSQFGSRLVTARTYKQLPQANLLAPLRMVHSCWQMDVDEQVPLPGYGKVHILNVVDYVSGLKIGSYLFPAYQQRQLCRVSWRQMQQALRQAFTKWGLPKRIRTDRDPVIVNKGNYPFPSPFTLWLVGLGIEHELIKRVIENGSVERSHRTWEGRLSGYGPYPHLSQWQHLVDYELWRMNAVLPSRGRRCHRRPPLMVYPKARFPLTWYRYQDELDIFDLARVQFYLYHGKWLRHTNGKGQFSFNNQKFQTGMANKRRWVQIICLPELKFQVSSLPDNTLIKTIQVNGLTISDITGISQ